MNGLKVLVGKEGWLFLTNDSNRVIEQITGSFPLDLKFSSYWRDLFTYRLGKSTEMGYKYFYFVAPNKEVVYKEFLPDGVLCSEERPVNQVINSIPSGLNFCYLLEDLVKGKSISDVYTKGDTHWSPVGALLGFNRMAAILDIDPVDANDVVLDYVECPGDLSSKLEVLNFGSRIRMKEKSFRVLEHNGIVNLGQKIVFLNKNNRLPSCVLFRDSFASHQIEFFASRFSRLVCLWQPNLDFGLINTEKPDYVVQLQAERFLVSVPDDIGGLTSLQYEMNKSRAEGFRPTLRQN